jgi:hypothetical protein
MTDYTPPLDDIRFVLDELVDLPALTELPAFAHVEPDVLDGVLEEAAISEMMAASNMAFSVCASAAPAAALAAATPYLRLSASSPAAG